MSEHETKDKSSHILNTSSNLLGLCFIVLTSLHVLKLSAVTWIDEFTVVAIVLFMTSSILSFLAMRTRNKRTQYYEKIADVFFLTGLISMFITTMFVAFGVIR